MSVDFKSDAAQKAATVKVIKARIALVQSHPFFGNIALRIEPKMTIDEDFVDTMATDGREMYFNVDFVNKITQAEVTFGIAHDVLHIALEHHLRMGSRDPKLWNIATDYVINYQLSKSGFTVPSFVLFDATLGAMSAEAAYERLKHISPPKNMKPGAMIGNFMPPDDATTQDQLDDAAAEVRVMVTSAMHGTAMVGGKSPLPPILQNYIKKISQNANDWEMLLREFMDSNVVTDQSWTRVNMTQMALNPDIILPGKQSIGANHIVICIDTSGSTTSILPKFQNVLNDIIQAKQIQLTTVIYTDTDVNHVDTYELGTEEIVLAPHGGGGTDFRAAHEYVNNLPDPPTVVIWLTDLYVYHYGEDPCKPVLWCVYGCENDPDVFESLASRTPFGKSVRIT